MKRNRRSAALAAFAVLGAVALVATGCSPGNTAPSTSDAPDAELPSTAWARADAADVQDGGSITLAVSALPSNWNPYQIDGYDVDAITINQVYDGAPIKVDESGQPVIDTDYASSAELTSDDPQVVEVKLNPAAVWEDGSPITVADYQATWQSTNGSNPDYVPVATTGWDQISSIEAGTDEYDMVITFSSAFADWKSLLTDIGPLKADIASDPTTFNTGYVSQPMPSSGPYIVSNLDLTGQVVTFEPNPLWWGDKPKLDTILFQVVSQDSQGTAFANGEIDAVEISANADLYQTAQTVDGAEIQASNGVTYTHVTMNASDGPLSDVNVRKAVASAVNREQIAANANTPVGVPPVTDGSYIFMPGQTGYVDDSLPFDVDAAAQFMQDAGYTKDGDTWAKDGEDIALTVTVPADTATNIQRAEQIQADLGDFGIPVEINPVPAGGYFSDYIIPGDFEMVTFSWQGTPYPISSSESIVYPLDSGQNFTGTTDDSLGDLWDQANAELDADARLDIAEQINQTIWDYVPYFPIAPLPEVWAVQSGLVNYGARQFESVDWTVVGFAAS